MEQKLSISDTEEYKEFEIRHNRHLNMLQDNVSEIERQYNNNCEFDI